MPFPVAIIDRCAPLHHAGQPVDVQHFARLGGPPQFLRQRQAGAAIAIRHMHQRLARLRIQRQGRLFQHFGAAQQAIDRRIIQRLEGHHARAGQQRRIEREGRVFRGRPHQRDGAILHHRQKTVLLRAVEPVDLIHEQQRSLPGHAPRTRAIEHLFQIGHAGKNRADLLEMQRRLPRQQPRHGGLSRAGWPPEDHRPQRPRTEQPRQRAIWPGQMILPHHLTKLRRTQPVSQRARRALFHPGSSEQVGHASVLPVGPANALTLGHSKGAALRVRHR